MDLDEIKRGLRAEIKKRENEQYFTFQTNVREMCKDVLAKLEEQETLIKEMREDAKRLGYTWQDYDAGDDCWEDTHTGKWVKAENDKESLHHKFKRCLAMARWCGSEVFVSDYEKDEPRMRWWIKWHTRWLKIAEKFKEAK